MRRSLSLSSSFLILTSYHASAGATGSNTFSLGRTANLIRSNSNSSFQKRYGSNNKNNKLLDSKLLDIRGGSTKRAAPAKAAAVPVTDTTTTDPAAEESEESLEKKKKHAELQAYRLQQQLYLQSRSLQLRQALISRGLTALQHGAVEEGTVSRHVDWDCAMATPGHSKSCLYSFDAEMGSKVVAPINTDQWITLSALNRLRRTDPTKVEPLWHSQYSILKTWLSPSDKYSLYNYLTPAGQLLSFVLDSPYVLAACMVLTGLMGLLLTLPFWESLIQTVLTHPFIWIQWPQWGRFVHAALPLKLLLGQLAYRGLADVCLKIYGTVRDQLIEWECQMWEECIPLTILEGTEYDTAGARDNDDDDILIMEEEDDDEDEDE